MIDSFGYLQYIYILCSHFVKLGVSTIACSGLEAKSVTIVGNFVKGAFKEITHVIQMLTITRYLYTLH